MESSSSSHPNKVEHHSFSGIQPQFKRMTLSVSPKLFDVFINHRGPDVKDTLALQLYNSLQKVGCRAFLDSQEIELGDFIPPAIENAISSASVQIAIFSPRYAESSWCLNELVLMLRTHAKIIPVFYEVKPWELRYIEKGVYADSFSKHENNSRYLKKKIQRWKEALSSASLFFGYQLEKQNRDYQGLCIGTEKLCRKVVAATLKVVQKTKPLTVAKCPVGLDVLVEDFERHCLQKRKSVDNIIGIYGMGGSGKTTLAKEVFNRMRSKYNASCFLFDIREASAKNEIPSLQTKLLKDLFYEDAKFQSTDEGCSQLSCRLGSAGSLSFLIVLDDMDDVDQLDTLLVSDTLSSGSLVIVTTRDERVLKRGGITLSYRLKEMDFNHSKELFSRHAFGSPYPAPAYETLVERFVKACRGLPLSLQVLGGHVSRISDKDYWQVELDKVCKTLPDKIMQRLKISFDALDKEQKHVFMDIACFFIGERKSMAISIWEGCGWSAQHALDTLIDKYLVELVKQDYFEDQMWVENHREDKLTLSMHGHLRDLGREMAQELIPLRLLQHNLRDPILRQPGESQGFQNIIAQPNGHIVRFYDKIYDSSMEFQIRYFIGNSDYCAERSSVLLWLQLYPCKREHTTSIPPWIPLQNLRHLTVMALNKTCHFERLWENHTQAPLMLKTLVLERVSLQEFPYSSVGMLKKLQSLILIAGLNKPLLIEGRRFSKSIRKLTNLKILVLQSLMLSGEQTLNNNRDSTAFESPMRNLEIVKITNVSFVSKISISGEYCPSLKSVILHSIQCLIELDLAPVKTLNCLELRFCRKLKAVSGISDLPNEICLEVEESRNLAGLSFLKTITLEGCWNLQNVTWIEKSKKLEYLHLFADNQDIWNCIGKLQRLPSRFMSVIGRAVVEAKSTLNPNLFLEVIGAYGAATEMSLILEWLLGMRPWLSTIIVCFVVLVQNSLSWTCTEFPLPSVTLGSNIPRGEWIVTTVISGQKEMDCAPKWIQRMLEDKHIIKGCAVAVHKKEEWKTPHVFQNIIAHLHEI